MTPMRTPALPPDLHQQVQLELRGGEKLVWAAQPLPYVFRRQAFGSVLFGIVWTSFALFWVGGAYKITQGGRGWWPGMLFPLFGVPFVIIGFGMLMSPLWLSRKARRTIYAITDQRAIVFEGKVFGAVNVQTFMPERLTSITRKERSDRAGDLIFEQFRESVGSGTRTVRRGFIGVERVRDVEDLIATTLLAGRTRAV